jgi:hypothetical protein
LSLASPFDFCLSGRNEAVLSYGSSAAIEVPQRLLMLRQGDIMRHS